MVIRSLALICLRPKAAFVYIRDIYADKEIYLLQFCDHSGSDADSAAVLDDFSGYFDKAGFEI